MISNKQTTTTICSWLAQREYKTRDMTWKLILWELCKKFKFDHTKKWYMHNPESVLENEKCVFFIYTYMYFETEREEKGKKARKENVFN